MMNPKGNEGCIDIQAYAPFIKGRYYTDHCVARNLATVINYYTLEEPRIKLIFLHYLLSYPLHT